MEFDKDLNVPNVLDLEESVKTPSLYFNGMSMRDYADPRTAVVREFFQNSVDAGCKNFNMTFDDRDHTITITDDGCGMNEDIIRNKLLVFGGTHKDNPDAIGSFGHAKILIYFSWDQYTINTRNVKVIGKAAMYTIRKSDSFVNGTISKIWLNNYVDDFNKIKSKSNSYFEKCNTSVNATMTVINEDGAERETIFKQDLSVIEPIDLQFDGFTVFIGSFDNGSSIYTYRNNYVYVRTKGVFMFEYYMNLLKSPIIVETSLPGTEVFTQNRDNFKKSYYTDFSNFITRLNNDNMSTVNPAFQRFIAGKIKSKGKRGKEKAPRNAFEYEDSFYIWGLTKTESDRYFNKIRAYRFKKFIEEFVKLYKDRYSTKANIKLGFLFDSSVEGRASRKYSDDQYIVYINPNTIDKFAPDKKHMAYKIRRILIHELAHVECMKEENNDYHNESFVNKMHEIEDLFWDFGETEKLFKKCWKEFV